MYVLADCGFFTKVGTWTSCVEEERRATLVLACDSERKVYYDATKHSR
jgi:hypothetical protein